MTAACDGYYIELYSEKATGISESQFHHTNETRFDFTDFEKPETEPYPIKVSRATSYVDDMVKFYTKVVSGKHLKTTEVGDVKIATVKPKHADVVLHFVKRPAPEGAQFPVG
jgi:hypothetical protein